MIRRRIEHAIREVLADTPVVLLNGARRTGKTTLAQAIAELGRAIWPCSVVPCPGSPLGNELLPQARARTPGATARVGVLAFAGWNTILLAT
jgi:Mg-chelatase subunit ChlI